MAPSTSSRASTSRSRSAADIPSALAKKKASSSQPSRKNKASWRRNIDLSEVDQHLESTRIAERLGLQRPGAEVKKKTAQADAGETSAFDATLFEVDTKGDEALGTTLRKRKVKKPLRFLSSLQNESAVPAVSRKGVSGSASSSGKTGRMSKFEQDRLRRIAQRPVTGPFGAIVESEQGNALEGIKGAILKTPEEDVWMASGEKYSSVLEDVTLLEKTEDWIQEARKKQVKTPAHLQAAARSAVAGLTSQKDAIGSKKAQGKLKGTSPLPVAPGPSLASFFAQPTTGQSYNPTFTSHASLLQKAYQVELAKIKTEEEEKAFKLRWDQAAKAQRALEDLRGDEEAGRMFRGMIVGEISSVEQDEEEKVEAILDDDSGAVKKAGRVAGLRKTKAQRQKEARGKALKEQVEAKKRSKALSQSLATLPSLQKTINKEQVVRNALVESRRLAKAVERASTGLAGQRSGKFRVPSSASTRAADEVQLGEELSEGLRGVKTEGNLFRDSWDGLMVRGRVEPRLPVSKQGRSGRKFGGERKKEYETHAYKRFE